MTKNQPPEKLEWEEPAPGKPKGSMWNPVARTLRNHPGEWACIGRAIPTGIISTVNKGLIKCFSPEGSFEAVSRNHTERWVADVYVRYVGEHQEYS